VDDLGPLVRVSGQADTGCAAANGSAVAVVDWKSNLYISADSGRTRSRVAEGMPAPNGVLIL